MQRKLKDNFIIINQPKKYVCPYCGCVFEWNNANYNPEEMAYTCEHCLNTFEETDLIELHPNELMELLNESI